MEFHTCTCRFDLTFEEYIADSDIDWESLGEVLDLSWEATRVYTDALESMHGPPPQIITTDHTEVT